MSRGVNGLGSIALLFFYFTSAQAGQVTLAWDAPTSATSLGGYKVYYGKASGNYTSNKDVGLQTTYTVANLSDGTTYYFAVKAYDASRTTESGFSNEVSKTVGSTAALTANFSANPTSGTAPLKVTFTDTSTGTVTGWSWDFGDGSTSTSQNPTYTYATAGTYTVKLTATGPSGTNTKTQSGYITVSSGSSGGTSGLVAAYNFEEASGTTVTDASGKGNNGTISGAVRDTGGKYGKALSFDGSNDWVTVNDSSSLDLTNGMTLQAWVYPTDSSGWRCVLMKEQFGGGVYYLDANNANTNQPLAGIVTSNGGLEIPGGPSLGTSTWVHLAATFDGKTQKLYVNGSQVASQAQSGSLQTSDGALRIGGNSSWGEFFKGKIDEVRIYNRALTVNEIQADMNRQ
jgi:PKD repeat protein